MPFLGKKPTEIASPVDINSGSIDGTTIGGGSASPATVTTFTSTGIDDNAASTAITIDSSGSVSINTTASNSQLNLTGSAQALGTAATSRVEILTGAHDFYSTPSYAGVLTQYDGTARTGTTYGITNANLGAIRFQNVANGLIGTNGSAPLVFATLSVERMRLDSSGNLLVGTTGSSDSARIEVVKTGANVMTIRRTETGANGLVVFRTGGGVAGTIAATSSTTLNYNTSSDKRLKENIVDAPAGNIDAIRVRSFDWKADGSHQTYGMVAQELVDVAPEAVSQGDTEDDMWGVDYSKLVPMMIKEIQDLKAEVAALKGA